LKSLVRFDLEESSFECLIEMYEQKRFQFLLFGSDD